MPVPLDGNPYPDMYWDGDVRLLENGYVWIDRGPYHC
jgi:hypothetical protein